MTGARHLVAMLLESRAELLSLLGQAGAGEGGRRVGALNSLSWIAAHVASSEHIYWNVFDRGLPMDPWLAEHPAHPGSERGSFSFKEALAALHRVYLLSEPYLQELAEEDLRRVPRHPPWYAAVHEETLGDLLTRSIMHHWYHIGEAASVLSALGHRVPSLPGELRGCRYPGDAS